MARVRIRIRVRVRVVTIGFRKNPQTTRFGALHTTIGVTETLIFALIKFSHKACHIPQIKMSIPYGIFLIFEVY